MCRLWSAVVTPNIMGTKSKIVIQFKLAPALGATVLLSPLELVVTKLK